VTLDWNESAGNVSLKNRDDGRETGKAGKVVKPETQMPYDCHIFNHATVPELYHICCVILQVHRRRGSEASEMENIRIEVGMGGGGGIKEIRKRIV